MFTIIIGIVNGEHLLGPFSNIRTWFSSKVRKPPAAELTTTPILYGSTSLTSSNLASLTASSAAIIAN